ncbi:MAG: CCA tRNA nucleotidyltransferase [Pseudomonadota bacterium]
MSRIEADWLSRPATQAVCRALTSKGAQALFVGGCVRNALLGLPVADIDLTTNARPEQVLELAAAHKIKAIPTGIDHGTVTLVVEGIPHEVTTFRRDVATDGRRAVVAYSDSIEEDAARRDFTINALYARSDGQVLDPLGGLPDLQARRIRFIGQASDRIREDYLRSLRFFRFLAWYGDPMGGVDPDALSAIASNLDGLDGLSRERIGTEILKLMAAPDPVRAVAAMRQTGVFARVLPGCDDRALGPLVHLESLAGANPESVRRLAVLGDMECLGDLRLSKAAASRVATLRSAAVADQTPAELGYRLGKSEALDALLLRAALLEQTWDHAVIDSVERGSSAIFPIRAKDLMPQVQGAELGAKLSELETKWIISDFAMTKTQLLADGGLT